MELIIITYKKVDKFTDKNTDFNSGYRIWSFIFLYKSAIFQDPLKNATRYQDHSASYSSDSSP